LNSFLLKKVKKMSDEEVPVTEDKKRGADEGDGESAPEPAKPSRKRAASTKAKAAKAKVEEPAEADPVFDLGGNRKVTVGIFKGTPLINIREFYVDKSGNEKPGTKGIALTVDQFKALQSQIDKIDEAVESI